MSIYKRVFVCMTCTERTYLQVSCTCSLHAVDRFLHSAAFPHQHRALGQLRDLNRKDSGLTIYTHYKLSFVYFAMRTHFYTEALLFSSVKSQHPHTGSYDKIL